MRTYWIRWGTPEDGDMNQAVFVDPAEWVFYLTDAYMGENGYVDLDGLTLEIHDEFEDLDDCWRFILTLNQIHNLE